MDLAGAGAEWTAGLWDGIEAEWAALLAWIDEAVRDLLDWLPGWAKERIGLGDAGDGPLAAPARPAESILDAGGRRTRVGGEVRIRFEGAPPGTRIERVRTDNPETPIDVAAGYAMAGT